MKRILFDIGHPAHVHLFRNLLFYLKKNGHQVVVVSRDKDLTNRLLRFYGIPARTLSRARKKPLGMLLELLARDLKVFGLHLKFRFDAAFGTSVSIAHLSAVTRVKSYVFEEDDDDIVPFFAWITYPFATGIIMPRGLRFKRWEKKRIFHSSLHELAYLHPRHFTPREDVPKKYGLVPGEYIIIRSSALEAHHDVNIEGLREEVWDGIWKVIGNRRVIFSREGAEGREIEPWDMHHVLAFARMLITDSQTMTGEAAVLGVPSVRCNSFVGRITVMQELENKYGLTFGFRPGEEEAMIERIRMLLNQKNLREEWGRRRQRLLSDKEDFAGWLVCFFEGL